MTSEITIKKESFYNKVRCELVHIDVLDVPPLLDIAKLHFGGDNYGSAELKEWIILAMDEWSCQSNDNEVVKNGEEQWYWKSSEENWK